MLKRAIAVVVIVVLHVVAACAPAAPTPTRTPEPAPTPVEVQATKPEHLVGTWFVMWLGLDGIRRYERFEADGTLWKARAHGQAEPDMEISGRFWFEDGVYYEEGGACFAIGSYRVYLEIEGGTAVGLRFEVIDDWDPECVGRRRDRQLKLARVDR